MKRKKLILIPLSLICALSFASCGNDTPNNSGSSISESSNSGGSSTTPSESSSSKSESTISSQSSSSSSQSSTHTHSYSNDWSKDANKHWHASTCGDDSKADEAEHTWDSGVEDEDGRTKQTCTVCGYEKTGASKYEVGAGLWYGIINSTNNYTFQISHDGTIEQTIYFTEDKYYEDSNNNGKTIYEKIDNKYYNYIYQYDQETWFKDETSKEEFDEKIKSNLIVNFNKSSWFTYNSETKKYTLVYLDLENGYELQNISIGFEYNKITSLDFQSCKTTDRNNLIDYHLINAGTTTIDIPSNVHEHTYNKFYTYDDCNHWIASTCGHDDKPKGAHTMVDGTCSVCGYKVPTDGLVYKLSSDGSSYSISEDPSYAALTGEVVIPSYYDGKPITRIDENAFYKCSNITSFVLPTTITSIGSFAFFQCNGIENFNIPYSVTSIERGAFYMCENLESVTIPNSVTTIGSSVFSNCSKLAYVVIGSGVTSIGATVIENCNELNAVYYLGTSDDWNKITIDEQITLDKITKYFYSENEPTDTTNKYWHYVEGVPTSW